MQHPASSIYSFLGTAGILAAIAALGTALSASSVRAAASTRFAAAKSSSTSTRETTSRSVWNGCSTRRLRRRRLPTTRPIPSHPPTSRAIR